MLQVFLEAIYFEYGEKKIATGFGSGYDYTTAKNEAVEDLLTTVREEVVGNLLLLEADKVEAIELEIVEEKVLLSD